MEILLPDRHHRRDIMTRLINHLFSSVCLLFIWSLIVSVLASPSLTSYQELPMDGDEFTLTCNNDAEDIYEVQWLINNDNVFKTTSGQNMTEVDAAPDQYSLVSDRVRVSATVDQHNVTLTINSTLDERSNWRCQINNTMSNELTINVFKPTTVSSSLNSTATSTKEKGIVSGNTSPSSVTELSITTSPVLVDISTADVKSGDQPPGEESVNVTYILAGCVGGAAVLLKIIIIIVCIRRKKQMEKSHKQDQLPKEYENSESVVNVAESQEVVCEKSLYVSYTATRRRSSSRPSLHSISEEAEESLVTDEFTKVQRETNGNAVHVNNSIEILCKTNQEE